MHNTTGAFFKLKETAKQYKFNLKEDFRRLKHDLTNSDILHLHACRPQFSGVTKTKM